MNNILESEYDNHPAPDHQKIIFAGKLLQDNGLLVDILQQVYNKMILNSFVNLVWKKFTLY
jgi:hypothetical protein